VDAWERAIAFMRTVDMRAAEEIVPFRWGRALINRRLNRVHDLNFLIADRLAGAEASDLGAEADRIQGSAGLAHRRVNVDDRAAADRLSPGFGRLGYVPERFVIMANQRRPDQRIVEGIAVHEVGWELMRPAREQEIRSQPWGSDPRVVEQLLAKHQLTAQGIRTRYFAAVAGGRVVSSCELRSEGDAAQVETVETLPEFRRRGFSRAVVSAALRAAAGYEFVFLVTDADDWPQQFYRRLGFQPVGIESRFLRLVDA
jgi:ribosomal protein S18 acetylase RimI-like enzyme